MSKGTVTLEFLTVVVRLHNEPTTWGEFAPYENGFLLHQTEPGVYEAKLATEFDFKPSHQRDMVRQLLPLGFKKVVLRRHKKGEAPYRIVITADSVTREND